MPPVENTLFYTKVSPCGPAEFSKVFMLKKVVRYSHWIWNTTVEFYHLDFGVRVYV